MQQSTAAAAQPQPSAKSIIDKAVDDIVDVVFMAKAAVEVSRSTDDATESLLTVQSLANQIRRLADSVVSDLMNIELEAGQ